MKKIAIILFFGCFSNHVFAQQAPCSAPIYRQFDFWLGEWEAFGVKGKKAGDSKISPILGGCVILEEWTGAVPQQGGFIYSGKSFNSYNATSKQWQQTWVDNAGGSTEYLQGKFEDNKMVFISNAFAVAKDTMAVRRLTFFNFAKEKVRQLGEISKDKGTTWQVEYDLEYRRKNK